MRFLSILFVFLAVPSFAADRDISPLVKSAFCSHMVLEIDTAATNLKGDQDSQQKYRKEMVGEKKNYAKRMELMKYVEEYEGKVKADTAQLADLVSIYKAADCDMVDAMRHMYCPEGWSRDCRWVYGEVQK
jgi:hypothetical protein